MDVVGGPFILVWWMRNRFLRSAPRETLLVIRYSIPYALTLNRLDLRIGTRGREYSSAEKLTDEDGHISGGRRIRRRSDC
jgi:hypothetical protein